jgi:alkaline phosphatase D
MGFEIDRRRLLHLGAFGAGALVIPGMSAAVSKARGFTHGVASGEPSKSSVLLWTRFVGRGETKLAAEISETESFDRPISGGEAVASPQSDHTAKVSVGGLTPNRWYFYRFRAPDGSTSPVGRTRTLPDGPVGRFALGLFSCSNIGFGWFNAYGHAAARQDLDLIVHVGDFYYEYQRGDYPTVAQAVAGRLIDSSHDAVHLADYRLRHAAYRTDPDLRRLMQNLPWVAMWDDHESANDSWMGGAENHNPKTEGPWNVRKAAAVRAYREWMPVSAATYEEYRIGDLATIFRPETRLTGRTHQLWLEGEVKGKADLETRIEAFRDGPWSDPSRTLMGAEQERLLYDGLRRSTAAGVRWQVLAQEVVMGPTLLPKTATDWLGPNPSQDARASTQIGLIASSLGLPFYFDNWDGYPAARSRLLKAAQEANANLVVLSGDSHNAWGFDLDEGGKPAGVEFAGQSVTSPGYEGDLPNVSPRILERAFMERNPLLKWANLDRRGYVSVELTPDRATGEWLMLDTVRSRSTTLAAKHRMSVVRGTNRLS